MRGRYLSLSVPVSYVAELSAASGSRISWSPCRLAGIRSARSAFCIVDDTVDKRRSGAGGRFARFGALRCSSSLSATIMRALGQLAPSSEPAARQRPTEPHHAPQLLGTHELFAWHGFFSFYGFVGRRGFRTASQVLLRIKENAIAWMTAANALAVKAAF